MELIFHAMLICLELFLLSVKKVAVCWSQIEFCTHFFKIRANF